MQKKNIVIIPARGGSKRLPGKNIKLLNKIPLIAHSILYAKKHLLVNDIIVSTDDTTIKKIALKYGAEVIDRPKELSTDVSTTVSAMRHVLESKQEEYDNVILLQVTNPLRPEKLLIEAYEKFIEGNYDSLMTVSRNEHKLGKIIRNKFVPFNYEIGQRSQDLEPLYYENGLVYISKSNLILENKILGENNHPYIVNHIFGNVDIDHLDDFKYAEFILENYGKE